MTIGSIIGFTILFLFVFDDGYLKSPIKDSSFMNDDFTCSAFNNITMQQAYENSIKSEVFKS